MSSGSNHLSAPAASPHSSARALLIEQIKTNKAKTKTNKLNPTATVRPAYPRHCVHPMPTLISCAESSPLAGAPAPARARVCVCVCVEGGGVQPRKRLQNQMQTSADAYLHLHHHLHHHLHLRADFFLEPVPPAILRITPTVGPGARASPPARRGGRAPDPSDARRGESGQMRGSACQSKLRPTPT